MMDYSQLKEAGIDFDELLDRMDGDEDISVYFLGMFLDEQNFAKLERAEQACDAEGGLAASHALKGTCGNLSMGRLHALFTEQVRLFRCDEPEKAFAMMPEIRDNYLKVIDAIKTNRA